MKLFPLRNLLKGEQVIAAYPPLDPTGQDVWHRRLNLYTGRTLSADALEAEQGQRGGRLAFTGQAVSPGAILGLEIALEDGQPGGWIHVAAGYGIAASGEDVTLPTNIRVDVYDLPVYAPISILRPESEGANTKIGGLALREMGPPLGELLSAEAPPAVPPVGILVLQPITLELVGEFDESDPCEEDSEADAFEDWQIVDGCRLVYYAWPTEWLALPASSDSGYRRNLIASAIFTRELTLPPGAFMPWENLGVPLGLLAFSDEWEPVFVDRYSVARAGGKPARRTALRPGNAFVWQARMEQLAEQFADPSYAGKPMTDVSKDFRFLPPAGILPKDAVTFQLGAHKNNLFPGSYTVDAVPIPMAQLDAAFEASAGLLPYDFRRADVVRLLVPVPEQWYEPELLNQAIISPAFDQAIANFSARRDEFLGRRALVRERIGALVKSLKGTAPTYADDLLPGEAPASEPFDPAEDVFGTAGSGAQTHSTAINTLRGKLIDTLATFKSGASAAEQDAAKRKVADELDVELMPKGLESYMALLSERINKANDAIDYGFLRTHTDIYRMRKILLRSDEANRLATSTALAGIVKDEQSAYATREQLLSYLNKIPRQQAGFDAAPAAFMFVADQPADAGANVGDVAAAAVDLNLNLVSNVADHANFLFNAVEFGSPHVEFKAKEFEVIGEFFDQPDIVKEIAETDVKAVTGQLPLTGLPMELRTTTIAQRFNVSSAEEAKTTTLASNVEVLSSLSGIAGMFDDVEVPIVTGYAENGTINRTKKSIKDLKAGNFGDLLNREVASLDEVSFFAASVDTIDQLVASLRLAEGQVKRYQSALELSKAAQSEIRGHIGDADRRLKVIADELAEARHDVAVAIALRAEEQARIDGINARRTEILDKHVPFVAYQRPRALDLLAETPYRDIEPAVTGSPVPACLKENRIVPRELRAMVNLYRDVPIRWFTRVPLLLQKLDRIDMLQATATSAKLRAQAKSAVQPATTVAAGGLLGKAIAKTFVAHETMTSAISLQTAQLDLSALSLFTWQQTRDFVLDNATLGDLIEAGHGNSEVAQNALRELDDTAHVASCLYEAFGAVLPALRLKWAEILSQFDEPVNLRNLSTLPDWNQIEVLERRSMQAMVDWLFNSVDQAVPQMVALVNDLVRVCILLASHAPVNQIIAGRIRRPTRVGLGGRLNVAVDLSKVHVGMQMLVYDKLVPTKVLARAVVEDMDGDGVSATVTQAFAQTVDVDTDTVVEFTSTNMLAQMALPFLR